MGVSVGNKKGVDVEINVVPLIDLMSCLTAFLLATVVWTFFSQINIKPKGLGRESTKMIDVPRMDASILVSENEIWVGQTAGFPVRIAKSGETHDWMGLKKVLDEIHGLPQFEGRSDIEVAADDKVLYQDVITAMDTAIAAQFRDIGFIDPQSLSVRFKE